MSMGDILARQIDDELYNHPGKTATVCYGVRKWKDRPALIAGEVVTIIRFTTTYEHYGWAPRLLVRNVSGAERWVPASTIDPDTITKD